MENKMSQEENSALNALADLMGLEEERVHQEETSAREAAEAEAARVAAEEKKRAEEEAARQAAEEEALRLEQEEKDRLEREERMRLAEAEAAAKAKDAATRVEAMVALGLCDASPAPDARETVVAIATPPAFHESGSCDASCGLSHAWPLKIVLSTTMTPPSARRPGVVSAAS